MQYNYLSSRPTASLSQHTCQPHATVRNRGYMTFNSINCLLITQSLQLGLAQCHY